ncbi:DUF4892 domain-containing protein [Dyella solisilvae]|uniref:DUF4892 domain-containing protein n=1 Tax=Dyella solisilvae TaxID=1920168 RepID=A0A370K7C0_9GAMM|nr:OmpA family protein [Dyella solisilvae]RDI98536.1 DUF4892 domain-containing protein [Dyella solisilvae]
MRSELKWLAAALLAWPLFAAATDDDDHGSKDHPLVSRFAGSYIRDYKVFDFDTLRLPLGPVPEYKHDRLDAGAKIKQVEGKITNITYVLPKNKSLLEVQRNYEQALAQGPLQTVYSCHSEACGLGMHWLMDFDQSSRFGSAICDSSSEGAAAYVARTTQPSPEAYVFIYLCSNGAGSQIVVRQRIVEVRAMAQGQVSVRDASYLEQQLAGAGHVAVDGIYFDTASATIRPESKPALEMMAAVLRQRPDLKVYVVGHTDNQGNEAANTQLSKSRAQAVVQSLTKNFGISQERVQARGAASWSPVASNHSETGMASNRRVEMVEQ